MTVEDAVEGRLRPNAIVDERRAEVASEEAALCCCEARRVANDSARVTYNKR